MQQGQELKIPPPTQLPLLPPSPAFQFFLSSVFGRVSKHKGENWFSDLSIGPYPIGTTSVRSAQRPSSSISSSDSHVLIHKMGVTIPAFQNCIKWNKRRESSPTPDINSWKPPSHPSLKPVTLKQKPSSWHQGDFHLALRLLDPLLTLSWGDAVKEPY